MNSNYTHFIGTRKRDEMIKFLSKIEQTDVWRTIDNLKNTSLHYLRVPAAEIEEYIALNDFLEVEQETLKECLEKGVLVLRSIENEFSTGGMVELNGSMVKKNYGNNYIFYSDSLILNLFERLGIKGPLISDYVARLLSPETSDTAKEEIYKILCSLYNHINTDEYVQKENDMLFLVRDSRLVAIFSNRYEPEPQTKLIQDVENALKIGFPDSRFIRGQYSLEFTTVDFHIASTNDEIMDKFKTAWFKAGLNVDKYDEAEVILRLQTSDIGLSQITITPLLRTNEGLAPLSESRKFKHYKRAKRTEKSVNEITSLALANTEAIAKLMDISLVNPVAAAVYLMKDTGLYEISKVMCSEMLELVNKKLYKSKPSAYLLYYLLTTMDKMPAFEKLSPIKKVAVNEKLFSILNADWNKVNTQTINSF